MTAGTLVSALADAHDVHKLGLTFLGPRLEVHDLSWAQIAQEAERRAAYLSARGVDAGDRIAMLVADNEEFVLAFFAAILIGAVPIPLYPPSALVNQQAQLLRAVGIIEVAAASWLVATPSLAGVADQLKQRSRAFGVILTDELAQAPTVPPRSATNQHIEPNAVCFLQFTSGSTAAPKGVVITHANVAANVDALHAALGSDAAKDIGVNWVPLYHDMGLIGSVVTPALSHARGVLIPTAAFALRPQIWLEQVHKYRGTMVSTNNYGLRAATKRVPKIDGLDLSCLRVISVGAERIHLETVQRFIDTFRPYRLDPRAVNPAYGMAEATLALSCANPEQPLRSLSIDARIYAEEGRAVCSVSGENVKTVVSCGRVIPGHEVAVLDEAGQPLAPGSIGELAARGPSITQGYVDQPEATRALFVGSWMRTGDVGFFHDGELFVSGRRKELVIIGGRNYDPQVVEWAVASVPGIRSHHVIAFSVSGADGEVLVVLAECVHPGRADGLTHVVRKAVIRDTGLDPSVVLIVLPWSLPRTSSGKLQRLKAREVFEAGSLRSLDHATTASLDGGAPSNPKAR